MQHRINWRQRRLRRLNISDRQFSGTDNERESDDNSETSESSQEVVIDVDCLESSKNGHIRGARRKHSGDRVLMTLSPIERSLIDDLRSFTIQKHTIQSEEVKTILAPEGWLNDQIMDAFSCRINSRNADRISLGHGKRIYIFSIRFENFIKDFNYDNVKRSMSR